MVKRFFYDCEFEESPEFGIRLISIGIVDEFGRELYLINNEYDWNTCHNDWLFANVKPFIDAAPEHIKVSKNEIKDMLFEFIRPSSNDQVELYGYYSAYDHVCLCQLFGKMVDLPEGIPMYTNDLKQFLDYFGIPSDSSLLPKIENEHDALSDAKWNYNLYKFLFKTGGKYV
jgi:hypothetical protein